MRGADERGCGLFSYVDLEARVPADHPLRAIRVLVDESYEEWGASASERIDPGASGRGLSLTLAPAWGQRGERRGAAVGRVRCGRARAGR